MVPVNFDFFHSKNSQSDTFRKIGSHLITLGDFNTSTVTSYHWDNISGSPHSIETV